MRGRRGPRAITTVQLNTTVGPAECHPRHFTKYTIMQKSKFLPRGRKDRTMVLVDIRETKSVKAAKSKASDAG